MSDSPRLSMALLCATALAPIVPLHGRKDGHGTCGDEDCELPGAHPRTPSDPWVAMKGGPVRVAPP
jgi:hypothetical protein